MIRKEIKQQRTVYALTPEEWDAKVNRALFEITEDTRKEPVVTREKTPDGWLAIIEYYSLKTVAETIRDEYELRGERHTCDECPHLCKVNDRRVKHLDCDRGMRYSTLCSQEACEWFYEELHKGRMEKPAAVEVGA